LDKSVYWAHHQKLWMTVVKTYALYISWLEWRMDAPSRNRNQPHVMVMSL